MNDGGTAFPQSGKKPLIAMDDSHQGMSLRDYFAAHALQGMLANGFQPSEARQPSRCTADYSYTEAAYVLADKMLLNRNRYEA